MFVDTTNKKVKAKYAELCNHSVQEVFQSLYGIYVNQSRQFEPVPQIAHNFSFSSVIRFSNIRYRGLTVLALDLSSLNLPGVILDETELQIDMVGEINNMISGTILASDRYVDDFGYLEMQAPIYSHAYQVYQKTHAIAGKFSFGETSMYFAHSVWANKLF